MLRLATVGEGIMIEFNYPHLHRHAMRVSATAAPPQDDVEYAPFVIRRRNRFWEVRDELGNLICVTVYKRGAREVARRLSSKGTT